MENEGVEMAEVADVVKAEVVEHHEIAMILIRTKTNNMTSNRIKVAPHSNNNSNNHLDTNRKGTIITTDVLRQQQLQVHLRSNTRAMTRATTRAMTKTTTRAMNRADTMIIVIPMVERHLKIPRNNPTINNINTMTNKLHTIMISHIEELLSSSLITMTTTGNRITVVLKEVSSSSIRPSQEPQGTKTANSIARMWTNTTMCLIANKRLYMRHANVHEEVSKVKSHLSQ